MLSALTALVLLAAPPSALEAARQHLEAGDLEAVLFAMDGKQFAEADRSAALDLLAKTGAAALSRADPVLALQFAQMALRLGPEDLLALEVAARAAQAQKQFGPAEQYADRWVTRSRGGARARLFRAELAMDGGEWERALELAGGLPEADLSDVERTRLEQVRDTCQKQISEAQAARAKMKSVERRVDAARVRATKRPAAPRDSSPVFCLADSDCPSGTHCSQVVVHTDRSWKQTLDAPANWMDVSMDDSNWGSSVEEAPAGGSPWGTRVSMPERTPAQWVWHRDSRKAGDTSTVYFRKYFTTAVSELALTVAADNRYEIYVDGDRIGTAQMWEPGNRYTLDVLPRALHVIAVRVVNEGGPGGLIVDGRSPLRFCQPATVFSP